MDGHLATPLLIFAVDIVSSYVITVVFVITLGTLSSLKFVGPTLDQFLKKQLGFWTFFYSAVLLMIDYFDVSLEIVHEEKDWFIRW